MEFDWAVGWVWVQTFHFAMGWVGLGQSFGGLDWVELKKLDPRTTLDPTAMLHCLASGNTASAK